MATSTSTSTTTTTTTKTTLTVAMAIPDIPVTPSSDNTEQSMRVVRFNSECVLIPEYTPRSRRPRLVTKSYALPLWKRRTSNPLSDAESAADEQQQQQEQQQQTTTTTTSIPLSSSPEDTHVVINIPIPSFMRKSSLSPSRGGGGGGRSPSTSPTIPLHPCLVQRSNSSTVFFPSSPTTSHDATTPKRRPSLPIYHQRKDDLPTIPLRACCPNCVPITEECLREGAVWKEKFTRGARRRRSSSLDNPHAVHGHIHPSCAADSVDGSAGTTIAITVDEVDKRRKTQQNQESPATAPEDDATSSHHHALDPLLTTTTSSATIPVLSIVTATNPTVRYSSPITEEEDEDELFPLPSPRRTPTASPVSSLSPSPRASPGVSPIPSPNTSSACLHPSSAALASASARTAKKRTEPQRAVTFPTSGSMERLGGFASISRKEREGEAPLSTSAPSSLSSTSSSSVNPKQTPTSSPKTSYKPRPLSFLSTSPEKKTSFSPTLGFRSESSARSPTSPTSPSNPGLGKKRRTSSYTNPLLRATEALRGAGVDVLKGVSSIGGGMTGAGASARVNGGGVY